jgi:hypothetical protein
MRPVLLGKVSLHTLLAFPVLGDFAIYGILGILALR